MTGPGSSTHALLEVEQLTVDFTASNGPVAVRAVDFTVRTGESVGLVGASGSGKSTLGFAIAGLLDRKAAKLTGAIRLDGQDLVSMSAQSMRKIRGAKIGFVFQEPATSLNPLLTIGTLLCEPLRAHLDMSTKAAKARALELCQMVELPDARRRLDQYPHELSGGMKQRVVLAAALACSPALLIADEPTTALDVTVQAQILDLLLSLKSELSTALIFVSHDLGVIARIADHVMVMQGGRVVESGPVDTLLARPTHDYTRQLLAAVPSLKHVSRRGESKFWDSKVSRA